MQKNHTQRTTNKKIPETCRSHRSNTEPGSVFESITRGGSLSPPTLNVSHSPPVPCTALPPPRYGYYYVEGGSGVSLGSVLVYWCQEGYQLVGSERLACLRQESTSSWSHPPPQCQGKEPSGATRPLRPLPRAQRVAGAAPHTR